MTTCSASSLALQLCGRYPDNHSGVRLHLYVDDCGDALRWRANVLGRQTLAGLARRPQHTLETAGQIIFRDLQIS
jgi:hypothetical protein